MTDSDANRRLVQQYWDAFNQGDMAAAAEFFADDTHNFGRPVGREGVLAVMKDIKETFPDVRFTPLQSMVEGEWVAVRGTFSGTHRGVGRLPVNGGMLVGVQPTGRHFEVPHIHLLQVRSGKIVEHFATRDDLGMMQQLGLLPAPGSPSADETRIRQLIAEEESAWNRGDAKAYASHFDEEGGFTNVLGTVYYGRRAFEERHAEIFATVFRNTVLSMKVQKIQFIRPDVAVVDIDTEMTGFKALPPGVHAAADGALRTRLQQVMSKEGGDWWIAAYHNIDVKGP
jgi:uncharacterized protein (TIGR02246 family)